MMRNRSCLSPPLFPVLPYFLSFLILDTLFAFYLRRASWPSNHAVFLPLLTVVINIGSMVGYKLTPWGSIYCATEAAVHSLSDALRMELRNYGIKVMVVAPGAIKSEIGVTNMRSLKLPEGSPRVREQKDLAVIPGREFDGRFMVQFSYRLHYCQSKYLSKSSSSRVPKDCSFPSSKNTKL